MTQKLTVQDFTHYDRIPATLVNTGWRLVHFTTHIRPDNSAVVVALWEQNV